MAHTNSWDETSPTDTTLATSIDDEIRKVRTDIRERMALDHNLTASDDGSGDEGLHKKVTIEDKIASPSLSGNQKVLYAKTGDNDCEIRYKDTRGVDSLLVFVGEVRMRLGTTVPPGWLALNGDSIGSATSGATHTGTNYQELYTFLWDELADTEFTIATGRGASAAADWSANKKGTMPDARAKSPLCAGTDGVLTSRTIGDTGGNEAVDLSGHTHADGTYTVASHNHGIGTASGAGPRDLPVNTGSLYPSAFSHTHSCSAAAPDVTGVSSGATGDNIDAVNVMHPWIVLSMLIRY